MHVHLDGLATFKEEKVRLAREARGVLVMGDINIHHRKWLKFSSGGNTAMG